MLRPPFPWRHTPVSVHPEFTAHRFPFFRPVSLAVLPECPRPPGGDHHCLEIVVAHKALRHWAVISRVVVDLLADHWSTSDEALERFLRNGPRQPLTVIAGLVFLGASMPNRRTTWGPNFTVSPSTTWNRGFELDLGAVSSSVCALAALATTKASSVNLHIRRHSQQIRPIEKKSFAHSHATAPSGS